MKPKRSGILLHFGRPSRARWLLAGLLVVGVAATEHASAETGAAPAVAAASDVGLEFFTTQVKPLLAENCFKCHGGEKVKAHLLLTRREGLTQGGEHGSVLSPDHPEASLLLQMLSYSDESHQMPPSGKLKPESIATLQQWVKAGAPWPAGEDYTSPAAVKELAAAAPVDKESLMWAVKPLNVPAIPQVTDQGWVRNPIDAFVLSKLQAAGLSPAPPADKITLIRRATYDLTGLPPSNADIDAFVHDDSTDAYQKVIDRLLASPHYGEKWGRHWLDLVRYAESNSYERDDPKPSVWRYRDYVIRAFNDDKPYDRYIKEQIAGDELPDGGNDGLIATGYYRLGVWDDDASDREQANADDMDDIVSTTGQTFMGLTVGCARCHDHKIDPFPQKDYYSLTAFFQNIVPYHNGDHTDLHPLLNGENGRTAYAQRQHERQARRDVVIGQIHQTEDDFRQLISGEPEHKDISRDQAMKILFEQGERVLGGDRWSAFNKLRGELDDLNRPDAATDLALSVAERGPQAEQTFVLLRGSAHNRGDEVQPAFPTIFHTPAPQLPAPAPGAKTTGRRLVLANWLASPRNQLTPRVMANRIWQYHFGRGIVRSSSNFGVQGDKPTHPELLDWLATTFVADGWHLKAMHRLIMTSNAYRMSSAGNDAALAKDPLNDLLWRFDMRRLTAEEVRDSVLAVDGSLNLNMFGPSVYVTLPKAVLQTQSIPGRNWPVSSPEAQLRRTIYIHTKRSLHVPLLDNFDAADTDVTCPVRFVTVQPTQALGMLNSTFLNESAIRLSRRLAREAGDQTADQVRLALRLATAHEPSELQVQRSMKLIRDLQETDHTTSERAMQLFCLMTLNLNEFVYLD